MQASPTDTESEPPLHETYHAALQHGHVEPAADALVLGVVAEQMYGIQTHIDRNDERLAPPRELLDDFKAAAADHGHNEAVDIVEFRQRYREALARPDRRAALSNVTDELVAGRPVWLVCYEAPDKFCHRHVLSDILTHWYNHRQHVSD